MKIEISERPTCTYKEKKNTKTNLHRNIFVDFFFFFLVIILTGSQVGKTFPAQLKFKSECSIQKHSILF